MTKNSTNYEILCSYCRDLKYSKVLSDEKDIGINMLIVSFPLQGIYISPNTPGSKVPSHGTSKFGEEYAIDFAMIQNNKKPYRKSFFQYLIKGLELDDFYGWGQTIYSPVNGEVIRIENDNNERNPVNIFKDLINTIKVTKGFMKNSIPPELVTGNYVMIKVQENLYALLEHLRKGSVNVKVGQQIKVHDAIGQLGHSGNSTMPHLHMQFMNSDNDMLLEGNLVKDPVERRTPQDTIICNFTIAFNRSYKKDDYYVKEVSYFNIEVWSTIAESCLKHLCKGRGFRVVGRLKQDRWVDEIENPHSRIKVVTEHVEFKTLANTVKEEEVLDVAV
ncbi:MAG: single-stranded DNA-binding protein [Spirochaetaceae bacterium]